MPSDFVPHYLSVLVVNVLRLSPSGVNLKCEVCSKCFALAELLVFASGFPNGHIVFLLVCCVAFQYQFASTDVIG